MDKNLQDEIKALNETDLSDTGDFLDFVTKNERSDIERKFRNRGKHHKSIIGKVNSGIDSMEFALGGELHNEIGISNNCIDHLYEDLKNENLENVCDEIKISLDSPKSAGGIGCSPGQHQGGQYTGELGL